MSNAPFDVFLSYSRPDHDIVDRVAATLRRAGFRVFLDRWYLVPGASWPEALERALARCRSVVVLLGPGGMGSWQQREQYRALDRQAHTPDFRVIPVVLPGTEDLALGFLGLNTWVDLRSDFELGVDLLARAVRGEPAGPSGEPDELHTAICPYRGLHPFREEDAEFFCGREAYTVTLLERIAGESLLAVVGASGSGKSSVVRAGLVPALRRGEDGGRVWDVVVMRPGRDPIESLASVVLPPEPGADDFDCIALSRRRAQQLAEGDVTLADVVERILERQPGTDRVLLVIDQAEELYTLAEADARTRFIDLFLEATNRAPLTVVLTLRGDFYGRALEHRALADRLDRGVVNLGPMNEEELARAILLPARKVGLQFEDGLVERILGDVGGEPGNLPLLEFLLEGLWQRRAHGRLAHTDYDALGGVAGAIVTRADAELHRMDAAQQMAARRFLVRLVAPGEGREDTRAVAELPGDDPVLESVVRQLANARLVVTDRGQGDFRQLVEVSHEALIRSWPQLRQWVDEDREFLRTLRRANDAKAMWLAEGRAADRLLQPGRQLGEAEELLARRVEFADLELRNYIAASQRRARRATHVRRTVALGALALAAVASLAAWGAITSRGEAERNRQIAEENRQLAEHRAERLSAALAEARASLIWSNLALKGDRLERQEVDALWQVATADPEARHAFLRQMGQSRSAALKFARQPEPMLRALGLTLSLEDKRALLEPVLALMAQTRDAKTLRLLARAAHAIPINLTTTQAKAAQNRVVEVFATTQDPYALQSLAEAMQALGVELIGATMREATVGRIMRGLTEHRDPYALQALARALRALPVQLSAAEGEAALQPILAGLAHTKDSYALEALADAADGLPVEMTAAQAQSALAKILGVIAETEDPYALQALASAMRSLPVQLSEGQKATALRPILAEFARRRDPYALGALADAAHALPTSLTGDEARAALGPVLQAIGQNTEPDALQALVRGVRQLAPDLNRRDATTLAGPVIAALTTQRQLETLGALVQAARALAPNYQVQSVVDGARIARAGLAAATTSTEAIAWATVLDTMLGRSEGSIANLVAALKYPTTALRDLSADEEADGSAEDFLLDQFQALAAKAGINAASLEDILRWIKQRHPEVDLKSPPTRPPPIDEFDIVDRLSEVREPRSQDR